MFSSFFPRPKTLFWSAALWGLFAILFWFFFAKNAGHFVGLENPPEDAPPVIGAEVFVTKPFWWFYVYFSAATAIFIAAWWQIDKHPWFRWSVPGTILIVFLTYFLVEINVAINAWYGPFYDLLVKACTPKSGVKVEELYLSMLIFTWLASVFVVVYSFQRFFVRHYVFRWRDAMHHFYSENWGKLRHLEGSSQRVQDDTMLFSKNMENEAVSILDAVLTLIAFLPILYGYSKHITELPIVGHIPQALVWASIAWAVFGTTFLSLLGIKLPGLEFKNQRVEAALRKELVYGEDDGTRASLPTLQSLFKDVRKNYFRLYYNNLYFDVGRRIYANADTVYSYVLLFPSVVAGTISFGLFQQIGNAFDKVRESVRVLVDDWEQIVKLISIYKRLRAFEATLYDQPLPKIEAEPAI
jgi:peptide/bleomycin uptake transporter